MFTKLKQTYQEFPETFWVLTFSSFIDQIGGFMLMPFIAIYMTSVFGLTMVQMGFVFIIVGVGNMIGGMIGGAITDKIGRKKCALYGLLSSGLFSIVFIFINTITGIYILVGFMGFLGSIGGPARQAMIADILPPKQRVEGFGIVRVIVNMSATIGPALGGLLAIYSFKYLFLADAITSFITAIIFVLKIPETLPKSSEIQEKGQESQPSEESKPKKEGGYKAVFMDWRFMLFVLISAFMSLAYMQMISTLPVFLTRELGFDLNIYGLLISMNAFMVVIFQFWITRKIKMFPALVMMAIGNLLYGIGFGMYGLIATVPLAFIAMIIITIGEMVVAPFSQSIAANLAPEDKRGRYMAVHGWSELFPMLFGIIGAGAIMDNMDSSILWYLTGIFCFIAAAGYVLLHFVSKDHFSQLDGSENSVDGVKNENYIENSTGTDVIA